MCPSYFAVRNRAPGIHWTEGWLSLVIPEQMDVMKKYLVLPITSICIYFTDRRDVFTHYEDFLPKVTTFDDLY